MKETELAEIKALSNKIGLLADKLLRECKTHIDQLGLSERAKNSLLRGGVEFVEQLVNLEIADLKKFRNMGIKTIDEIKYKVKSFGFNCWE